MMRKSYNVESATSVDGKPQRFKEHLVLPMSLFGTRHERMPGGSYDVGTGVGGIVFESEEVAVEVMEVLEEYFGRTKLSVRRALRGWFYRVCRALRLRWEICRLMREKK